MKLATLFSRHRRDWSQTKLAELLGCDRSHISHLAKAHKPHEASVGLALQIEAATGGLVRAEEIPMSAENRAVLRQIRQQAAAGQSNGDAA